MKRILSLTLAIAGLFILSNLAMAGQTTYICDSMADAYLDQRDPDLNFGDSGSIKIVGDPLSAEVVRGIIRFNIPSFITASQIQSATLNLYGQRSDVLNVEFYAIDPPVGENWFEKVVPDPKKTYEGVTWNEIGGVDDSTDWSTPGGDYDTSVSDYGKIAKGWNVIGVKTLVTWKLDKVRRFGILIKLQDETEDIFNRVSSKDDTENHPYLKLVVNQELSDGDFTCAVTDDTYIDEGYSTYNFNHKTRIMLASNTINHYGLGRGLLKFDIPCNINSGLVASATMHLSGTIHAAADAVDVYCYALNDPFDEETDTWDTLTGGNFDTGVSASGSLPLGGDWETTIDMTALLSGNLDKVRDNGIIMVLQNEYQVPDVHQHIASKECYDPEDFATYLEITVLDTDSDSDGVPDYQDNCPNNSNPDQEDTYPTYGGNGIGDVCECEGDFNFDGDVDGTDAVKFKQDFFRKDCSTCYMK